MADDDDEKVVVSFGVVSELAIFSVAVAEALSFNPSIPYAVATDALEPSIPMGPTGRQWRRSIFPRTWILFEPGLRTREFHAVANSRQKALSFLIFNK